MECYYLFRDHELVFSCAENAKGQLGAGDSHAHGQPGDVLICAKDGCVQRGWYWIKPGTPQEMPWKDIPTKDFDQAKYKVLLLLQQ